MARADFTMVHFNRKRFTETDPQDSRNFFIGETPSSNHDAYVLIQAKGVSSNNHEIRINGTSLIGQDLVSTSGDSWVLWMNDFPASALKVGTNTVEIERKANDDFQIGSIIVNWRE